MPLNNNGVEQIAHWCAQSEVVADIRAKARSDFFGYDEPGTIKYMGGTEELNTGKGAFWVGSVSTFGCRRVNTRPNWRR